MLRVIKDNFLVEEIKNEEITRAGIVVPNIIKGGVSKGIVVNVGDDISVLTDEIIFFKKHMATEIKHGGQIYFVVKSENVLAVI